MPERDQPEKHDQLPGYYQAYRFPDRKSAGRVYFPLQELIKGAPMDISAYRFQLNGVYHAAILGPEPLPEELRKQVAQATQDSEPALLPEDVLNMLFERHREVMRHRFPWMEGHYNPGQ